MLTVLFLRSRCQFLRVFGRYPRKFSLESLVRARSHRGGAGQPVFFSQPVASLAAELKAGSPRGGGVVRQGPDSEYSCAPCGSLAASCPCPSRLKKSHEVYPRKRRCRIRRWCRDQVLTSSHLAIGSKSVSSYQRVFRRIVFGVVRFHWCRAKAEVVTQSLRQMTKRPPSPHRSVDVSHLPQRNPRICG